MSDLPSWLQRMYPFPRYQHSSADGELNYVDAGSGRPVVMLHGNPTWSFFYRHLIRELSPDFRCLALDHLGCGLSDKPGNPALYTLERHIERALAWIDSLELDQFDLVVHDWGGAIGMGVATRIPEKIRRIVIFNTGAFPSDRIPLRIAACRWPVVGTWMVRGLNAFALAATRMTTARRLAPGIRNAYLHPYDSWANRIAIDCFVKDIPMRNRHPSRETLQTIAGSLHVLESHEMAIIWGGLDWCFDRSFLREWQSRFPRAETHLHDDAGHYLMEDKPTEIPRQVHAFFER